MLRLFSRTITHRLPFLLRPTLRHSKLIGGTIPFERKETSLDLELFDRNPFTGDRPPRDNRTFASDRVGVLEQQLNECPNCGQLYETDESQCPHCNQESIVDLVLDTVDSLPRSNSYSRSPVTQKPQPTTGEVDMSKQPPFLSNEGGTRAVVPLVFEESNETNFSGNAADQLVNSVISDSVNQTGDSVTDVVSNLFEGA